VAKIPRSARARHPQSRRRMDGDALRQGASRARWPHAEGHRHHAKRDRIVLPTREAEATLLLSRCTWTAAGSV